MKATVLIANYNNQKYLKDCINSLLKQSYKNKKIIFFIDKGYILSTRNDYKDFISINDLCKAIYLIIKKPVYGIYNLSIGRKIYLKSIVKWLNYYNSCSFLIKKNTKKNNNESFTLNNSRLIKKINMKIKISSLKKECKKLSKNYFNKRHAK